jgi:hypothetical protein
VAITMTSNGMEEWQIDADRAYTGEGIMRSKMDECQRHVHRQRKGADQYHQQQGLLSDQ